MNEALGRLFTLAGLAIFVGFGVLAWQVGETWTSADTQSVITAAAVICGGTAMVAVVAISVFIGVPLARKLSDQPQRPPLDLGMPQRRQIPQMDAYGPPMLTAHKDADGAWQGGGAVDIWEDVTDAMTWDGK